MTPEVAQRPLLAEATERVRREGRPILVSQTRRVAPRDALEAFAAGDPAERGLWLRPDDGEALVSTGAARTFVAPSPEHVGQAWRDLLREAVIDDEERLPWTGPLLLGGFAFDPLPTPSAHWEGFPSARLVLPTTILAQRHGEAWETRNVVAWPASSDGPRRVPQTPACEATRPARQPDWQSLVADVVNGIRDGSLGVEKLVLAREAHVQVNATPETALRRLAAEYPTCTIFAIQHAGACFLGATPERLAHADRGLARTMALAGSIARGASPAEDDALGQVLLASPKERAEHALVVRAIRAGLSDPELCTSLSHEVEPRLARLPNVQHLLTPISAQLAPGKSLLDLVARLHPSPAVAGFPQNQALAIVRQREGFDRGWYGGPLGWLNAAGDGEFVVAIRAGLLRGRDAWLYAGCGILPDSDPAAEYAESELKLRPMRSALGLPAA